MHPAPEINQHHTAEDPPPAYRGYEKVVVIVAKAPEMEAAKERVAKKPNSRLKTFYNMSAFTHTRRSLLHWKKRLLWQSGLALWICCNRGFGRSYVVIASPGSRYP